MGWGSASGIFETVADALIHEKAPPYVITAACEKLIRELSAQDWDTQDEALETYTRAPQSAWVNAVIQAFVLTGHAPAYCGKYMYNVGLLGRTRRLTCSKIDRHEGPHESGMGEWE
jgi:hypothetical protein